MRQHRLAARIALAVLGAACFAAAPARANTSVFVNTPGVCGSSYYTQCYHAGEFGVLVGLYNATTNVWTPETVKYTESGALGADVNAAIGVGSGSKLTWSSGTTSRTWDGPIDYADTNGGTTLQSGSAKITVTNGTAVNSGFVASAMNEIGRMSAYYAGLTGGTSLSGNLGVGSKTSLGISGTHTGGVQLYTATTINTSKDITIFGNANDLVIVNVTGSTAQFNNNITLSGGITADQVFFNILGTNSAGDVLTATTSGKVLNGVFYVANDSYTVSTQFGGTAAGQGARLLGGVGTSTWGANFVLNDPPEIFPTPEPSTWAGMAAGLGALVYFSKRRKA